VPFALVHAETKRLAAVAWFGPKPLGRKSVKRLSEEEQNDECHGVTAGEWHTLAYRSYPPFRGKGLMKSFVGFVMNAYLGAHPGAKLWVGLDTENPGSLGLSASLGFVVDEEASDRPSHWLVAVK
jgi:hypothetical protein